MITWQEYINNLYEALCTYRNNNCGFGIYEGEEGAKHLARELGYGLASYKEKEIKEAIQCSYGAICVRFYNLRPPVNAKTWAKFIMEGIEICRKKDC